jgi:hypothetical protein
MPLPGSLPPLAPSLGRQQALPISGPLPSLVQPPSPLMPSVDLPAEESLDQHGLAWMQQKAAEACNEVMREAAADQEMHYAAAEILSTLRHQTVQAPREPVRELDADGDEVLPEMTVGNAIAVHQERQSDAQSSDTLPRQTDQEIGPQPPAVPSAQASVVEFQERAQQIPPASTGPPAVGYSTHASASAHATFGRIVNTQQGVQLMENSGPTNANTGPSYETSMAVDRQYPRQPEMSDGQRRRALEGQEANEKR